MSRRTKFEDPGRMLRFSAELDPVGLTGGDNDEAALRGVQATTAIKLALVLGERIPVLAQNQVYDSPLVHALFEEPDRKEAEAQARERDAFLWLIAHDYIQLRIHPDGLNPAPERQNPFRLRNACASALSRQAFELSGWPVLTGAERLELAAIVDGRSSAQPPPYLKSRVSAIEQLDLAFERSRSLERATEITTGLDTFIQAEVNRRAGLRSGPDLAQRIVELRDLAAQVESGTRIVLDGAAVTGFNLDTRSDWRKLIRAHGLVDGGPIGRDDAVLDSAQALVDLAYNRKVALSLGAPFQREAATSAATQELYLHDPDVKGVGREVAFLTGKSTESWLSWSYVKDRLKAGDVPNESNPWRAEMRESLVQGMSEDLVAHRLDDGVLFKTRVWMPHIKGGVQGATAAIGTFGGLLIPVDPFTGSIIGAAVGGMAGHYVGMVDPAPQLRKWLLKKGVKALAAEMRTGA